jgi:hypothetical protein
MIFYIGITILFVGITIILIKMDKNIIKDGELFLVSPLP